MMCECGSKFGYVRIITGQWVCRTCGKISLMPTAKKMAKDFVGIKD